MGSRANSTGKNQWGVLIVIFMSLGVLLLAKQSMAQAEGPREGYACWGGCYNQCIIQTGKSPSQRLPCYLACLEGCIVRPMSEGLDNYCELGCSLMKCIKRNLDGRRMQNCLNHCSTKICARNT